MAGRHVAPLLQSSGGAESRLVSERPPPALLMANRVIGGVRAAMPYLKGPI
jgi:hypothetical protein